VRRLDARDVDTGWGATATARQVFDIEGSRLALGTDISDWRGTLLIHDVDRSSLARLESLLFGDVVRAALGHGRIDARHWRRARNHLQVGRISEALQPDPVLLVSPTCLIAAFEAPTGR